MALSIDPVRTHISTQPEIDKTWIYDQEGLEYGDKPNGLWYAFGDGWLDWCRDGSADWIGPYQFDLDIDTSRLLVIRSRQDLVDFSAKYGNDIGENYGFRSTFKGIDWKRVTQAYAGVEFLNYRMMPRPFTYERNGQRVHEIWYASLSIDSGCIWDLSVLKGVQRKDVPEAMAGAGRYPPPDTF